PPDEVMQTTGKYMNKLQRVLKPTANLLYITYRQPHIVKPIVNRVDEWDLELDVLGGADSSFEYLDSCCRNTRHET
ncbi:hypothetical protein K491DRAFT_615134, partial [Lophiostoma macrostomum CBS 122681]